MSSHHIVREKQEPALLILGMNNFSDELLGQLLEWSPTVITTPLIAEKLNSSGIKIDWVITDTYSGDIQSDIKYLPADKNSVTISALNYLVEQGYPAVNIITDDFLLTEYLPYSDKINLVIFYDHQKIYPVNSGFSKWKPAGENITLLSKPENIRVKGLEEIDHHTYKTTVDGFFSLDFDNPLLFIAEDL
jgi:thiamine pyrophosphokinase